MRALRPAAGLNGDGTTLSLDQLYAAAEVIDLARCLARARGKDEEWASGMVLPRALLSGEQKKHVAVGGGPSRVAVPGELVRIDFDIDQSMLPLADEFRRVLRALMPPAIGRVGDVTVEDTPEGVVVRRNFRPVVSGHDVLSAPGVATGTVVPEAETVTSSASEYARLALEQAKRSLVAQS